MCPVRELLSPLLRMKVDIFEVIKKELERQKRKAPWLAGEVDTSPRNMHALLTSRKDIYVEQLANISIALRRNLFKLYIPIVDAAIRNATQAELIDETKSESKSKINISIKYPESGSDEVGFFLKQVKLLAKEYGFEIE